MCAFGAHTIKEVTRSQMSSAVKFFLGKAGKSQLQKADKSQLIKPLAMAFLEKKVVRVDAGANMDHLVRGNVHNEGRI